MYPVRPPPRLQAAWITAVWAALVVSTAAAQQVRGSELAPVSVTRIDGTVIEGLLEPQDEPGVLAIRTPHRVERLRGEGLLGARFPEAQPLPDGAFDAWIWTHDGSKFPATLTGVNEGRVTMDTSFGPAEWNVADIAAVLWQAAGAGAAVVDEQLAQGPPRQDVLIVTHQDKPLSFNGSLESLRTSGGVFRYHDRSLEFEAGKAIAVLLAPTRPIPPAAMTCVLADSGQLAGEMRGNSATHLHLATGSGWTPSIPLAAIRELRFRSTRVTYLSALTPGRAVQRAFFDVPWPARFDAAVTGGPLSLGGRTYARGIGVHAHSELTYELPPAERHLAATIGIDDHVRPRGSVVFKVLADGRPVFDSGPVSGADPPQEVLVELGSATTLTLVVESDRDLDLGDHADWADVRVIEP